MSAAPFVDAPAAARLDRDVVRVSGPEAVDFLQGQLSQEVSALAVGDAAWSFLLEPQGHLVALLRVIRAEAGMLLVVDAGLGQAVAERLERFKLRVKADIGIVPATVWAVRGGGVDLAAEAGVIAQASPGDGHPGVDVVLDGEGPPPGLEEVPADWYEALRIEARIPTVSVDVPVGAIPAETGMVDRAVSFTKGCYTGQELVARVDSRGGRAPHQLVVVTSDSPTDAGSELFVDGEPVGVVTSAVGPPVRANAVGLARVKRSVELPAEAQIGPSGGVARLDAAPLVS